MQDADKKGLSQISDEVKKLAKKAKENSLKPEDYEVKDYEIQIFFYFLVFGSNNWQMDELPPT